MASIHKVSASPYWMAKFVTENGRPTMRSTKTENRSEAMKTALEWEAAAKLSRAGELTRTAALSILGRMVEHSTGERLHDPSSREFFTQWLAAKAGRKAAGTMARYKPPVVSFLAGLGQRADKTLRGLTTSDIEGFISAQLGTGKSNGTVNLDAKIVRMVLADAQKQGLLTHNPAGAVEMLANDEETRLPFAPEHIAALLGTAGEEWKGMILLGAHAGLRINDAASLTWESVDLAGQSLTFSPQKTHRVKREALTVALHPDVVAWLDTVTAGDDPAAPVFPSLYGKKAGSAGGLSNAFRRLMETAKVTAAQTRKKAGRGRGFTPLTFHSLRHYFVSMLTNQDVSADVRKAVAGHSSDKAHARYSHLELETQRRAVKALPSLSANDLESKPKA